MTYFSIRARIVSVLLLCVGTALFSGTVARYEIVGENLLGHGWIQDGKMTAGSLVPAQAWDDAITLKSATADRIVSVRQTITVSPAWYLLSLSCEARAIAVVPGVKGWERARVVIFPLNREGEPRYDVPHALLALEGTVPWRRYEQVFRIPDGTESVSVALQLLNTRGTLDVRALSLWQAVENPVYSLGEVSLRVLWAIMGAWSALPLLWSARQSLVRAALIALGAIILAGVLLPASVKLGVMPSWLRPEQEVLGSFRYDLLPTAPFRFDLLPARFDVYKLAHFLLFTAMGYLILAFRPYAAPIRYQIGLISLFALTTECMQVLALGRGGSTSDVLLDLAGVCSGLLVAHASPAAYPSRRR